MKPKSRIGKADSIFAKTTATPAPPKAAVPAPAGSSVDNKLTVILPPDQVSFLDKLCLDIRAATKSKIRRTEVIRAFIAGVRDSGIDLTDIGTEEGIAGAIRAGLKA